MQGIVCDVGHTIITNSVLNALLSAVDRRDVAVTLYDDKRLGGLDQDSIDAWVRQVTSQKISALKGISVQDVEGVCMKVELRAGFESFVERVLDACIPILFVGAVPELITRCLLKRTLVSTHEGAKVEFMGSEMQLEGDCIAGPGVVCTPSLKAQKALEWAKRHGVPLDEICVIGDSIGDIPVMKLVRRSGRVAIKGGSAALESISGFQVQDFFQISKICFPENGASVSVGATA